MADKSKNTVLIPSNEIPTTPHVKGYDFNAGIDLDQLLQSYATTGFQATNFSLAVEQVNQMLNWRLSDEPYDEEKESEDMRDPSARSQVKCTIFLGYTSNMISCGVREIIRFLVQHRLVDVIVTTAGGVEEDFIKCLAPTHLGDFHLDGVELRSKGLNRIGNLLVPNRNYCLFEEWIMPLLDQMVQEQKEGTHWSPSSIIARLGKEINNESSVYYWAWKNDIPVFCPALTDGSIGDMIFFHSYQNPGLIVDIAADIKKLNEKAVWAKKSGIVILGGGVVKHHICNANLMRNGADYAVFINTANDFDGSDSGAQPDEAKSWGKLRPYSSPVKIFGEASFLFPLLVAQSFAKYHFQGKTHF